MKEIYSAEFDLINPIKSLVTHFHHSPQAEQRLKEIQQHLYQKNITKAIQSCPTRWNSCLHMLQWAFDNVLALRKFIDSYPNEKIAGVPIRELSFHFRKLPFLIRLLIPFEEATAIVSAENYPTLSMVLPLARGIWVTLTNITDVELGGDPRIIKLRNSLTAELEKRVLQPSRASLVDKYNCFCFN